MTYFYNNYTVFDFNFFHIWFIHFTFNSVLKTYRTFKIIKKMFQHHSVRGLTKKFQGCFFINLLKNITTYPTWSPSNHSPCLIAHFSQWHFHRWKHLENTTSRILCSSSSNFCFISSIYQTLALEEGLDLEE